MNITEYMYTCKILVLVNKLSLVSIKLLAKVVLITGSQE